MDNRSENSTAMKENFEGEVCVEDEPKETSEEIIDLSETPIEIQQSTEELNGEVKQPEDNSAPQTPAKCSDSDDKAVQKVLIDINFRNKKTYFAFHEEFIEIIKKYYRDKVDDLDISDDASNKRICISEKLVKRSDSFLIDTTPSKNTAESTPRYTSFSKVILSNIKDNVEEKSVEINSANKCFNCDGTHSLRQCPEPKNMSKIRKARNEFNRRELRYHDNELYADLIPGQISDDLRNALGLTDNQLPLHVYKMRYYGYPSAWLEEAKVYLSGLQIVTDKNNETGGDNRDSFKYDIQRIYDFPGFNVVPTTQYVDKHRLYNLPPMQDHHSKENFIQSLGDEHIVNGYKKRKLRDTIEKHDTSTNIEDIEMDVEDDVPCNQSNNSPEEGELSDNSLNCEELDETRNKLLTKLSEMNDAESEKETSLKTADTSQESIEDLNGIQEGHIETTIFGCPVLPAFSSFETLPSNDKFQEGVCDVIAFENLSESTGKYEKMKGIIKKVRGFVKEHQQE